MDIPIKPSEAAALADLVFQELEKRPLTDQTRAHIAARLGGLALSAIRPHTGSLARDPVHSAAYYLVADVVPDGVTIPVLLRLALASSHSGEIFRNAALIGRMRPGGGREVIVDAIPFSSTDHENIRLFAERIDTLLQPRAQGAQPALVVAADSQEAALPPVFDAYRTILKRMGWSAAAIAYSGAPRQGSSADLWHAAVWAAIRAGWRESYRIEAHHIRVAGHGITEDVEETIRHAAAYSKFRLDASHLIDYRADHRTTQGWSEPDIERLYEENLAADLRAWIESEFSRPFEIGAVTQRFAPHEVRRFAVKFGRALLCIEQLYDAIAKARSRQPGGTSRFDCEPSFASSETITRAKELTFCLYWLKERGRPAQSIVANLAFLSGRAYPETTEEQLEYIRGHAWDEIAERTGVLYPGKPLDELAHRVTELAATARYFGAALTVQASSGTQPAVLQAIGRATGGRVNVAVPEITANGGDARAATRRL
ncbi:MAG TPA: tagaturonate epimerase family protein, partial [Bryobacteraceae bacterium]|nr:tagaturonate epimerase family protein [Bryobacteraceae bacterium]